MLGGILGRGFASRCKSLIKVIKSRIDVIRRKRSATLKFLKKDIADLLANGLDINAFGRVEGYIAELLLSSCYDFIEKCCDFVSKHASVMEKLSDCPEDCREAVSSLMFAAARFSDLPELRDLRQIFHERYENSLDLFVNKQLVENSTSNPSTMERKVKVMNDIVSEFSIKWDSKAFERRMSKPPPVPQDQPKNYGSFHVNGGNSKSNVSKRDEMIFLPKSEFLVEDKPCHARVEAFEKEENVDVRLRQKQEVSAGKPGFWNGKDVVVLKTARLSSSSGKRMGRVNGETKIQDDRENHVRRIDNKDVLTQRKPDLNPSNHAASRLKSHDKDLFIPDSYADVYSVENSTRKTHEEGESKRMPHSKSGIPPYVKAPGIKSKDSRHGANIGSSLAGSDSNGVSSDLSITDKEGKTIPPMRGHDRDTDYYYSREGSDTPIPRRRSSHRRHLKSASSHTEIGDADDTEVARRKPRSRRRDDSRLGLQILFDDERCRDEEEMIIDRLLMHYSKKQSSYEDGQLRRKSNSRHAHYMRSDVGQVPQKSSRDRSDDISETIPRPVRSISLPRVQTAQSEGIKVYTRATSFQPDRSNAARHVHPKLPDYDDLAAHFAAMKGK
ncbi:Detected protein of unknown function [Hibiscus syriacus]|uniref:Uncharacterized protein n=1 Tax=Hibiscus syriacus TaxID=106335 RepID=A0A6A2Z6A6_HIBSY|nr:uncharacterized protein LOC120149953 [Hibiscus syriacus]KAE8687521.1 Detected protein of unknown function [Hibiscus syriacus]